MTVHKVKSWIVFFEAIERGVKTHELRLNDRNYHVGDVLDLQEYDNEKSDYTGRTMKIEITYITSSENPCAMSGAGLKDSFVILSVKKTDASLVFRLDRYRLEYPRPLSGFGISNLMQ